MRIRNYADSDYDELKILMQTSGVFTSHYDSREMLKRKIDFDPETIIILEKDGKIIGSVFIVYDPWSPFIYRLSVHEQYRGKGIGKKLMEEAEKKIKERGGNPITIFVYESNSEVIEFYKKLGYSIDKEKIIMGEKKV